MTFQECKTSGRELHLSKKHKFDLNFIDHGKCGNFSLTFTPFPFVRVLQVFLLPSACHIYPHQIPKIEWNTRSRYVWTGEARGPWWCKKRREKRKKSTTWKNWVKSFFYSLFLFNFRWFSFPNRITSEQKKEKNFQRLKKHSICFSYVKPANQKELNIKSTPVPPREWLLMGFFPSLLHTLCLNFAEKIYLW